MPWILKGGERVWCGLLPRTGGQDVGPPGVKDSSLALIQAAAADQAAGRGMQQVFCLFKEIKAIECVMRGRGAGARETGKGLPAGEIGKGQFFPGSPVLPSPLSWGK